MIIPQQLVQEINRLVRNVSLILRRDKPRPRFPRVSSQQLIILRIQPDIVLVNVRVQFVRPQHFRNLHQLVIVVVSVEEGFFSENLFHIQFRISKLAK